MNRYWISWEYKENTGEFELHRPWWVSGYGDDYATICAAVIAENEDKAKELIYDCYDIAPAIIKFRFCLEEPSTWSPFTDRFPMAEWMDDESIWPKG